MHHHCEESIKMHALTSASCKRCMLTLTHAFERKQHMDPLTILLTSLLCFWALILVVTLQAMQGLRTLRSYQKYLNLCSEDEWRSYGFGTTWEWVINDRIIIFGWTNPLRHVNPKAVNMSIHLFVHLSGCIIKAPFGGLFYNNDRLTLHITIHLSQNYMDADCSLFVFCTNR